MEKNYINKNIFKKIDINDIDKILEDMKVEKTVLNFFSNNIFFECQNSSITTSLIEK